MKYLIFELFSGVGLCNQLFSLETGIYLASIMDRKLILLIKNPLCHCGKASWDYGYLLNFFTTDFHKYLPNGIEVYYKTIPPEIIAKTRSAFTLDTKKFSEIVFVDEELNTPENAKHIKDFCHARLHEKFDIKSYDQHEYMYLHKTNASRCLYNFYTTKENYKLMYDICCSLKFKPIFYELAQKLYYELPNKKNNVNIFLHLRFGDHNKDKKFLERSNSVMIKNLSEYLDSHKTNMITPVVYALVDNKNNESFNNVMKRYRLEYVDNKTKNVFSNHLKLHNMLFHDVHEIKQYQVVDAIIEMIMASMADEFIGYVSSTFSNYIQFLRYVNKRSYYNYSNLTQKNAQFCRLTQVENTNIEWKRIGFCGGHPMAWHYFFKPFPDDYDVLFTIDGKMDGFGSQLQACFSMIAYCNYKGYKYVHKPFYHMTHNEEKIGNFHDVMNKFINIENKFPVIDSLTNEQLSRLHRFKEGFYVHGSLHPEFFYTPEVLKIFRDCYYSTPKPNIDHIFEKDLYHVAIHIRRGDVNRAKYPSRFTSNGEYLVYLSSPKFTLNTIIHIFSEGKEEDFKELKTKFPNIRMHLNTNIQETFHCLVKANLLVLSRSSFCYCAGLLNENKVDGHFIKAWWHKPLKQWL